MTGKMGAFGVMGLAIAAGTLSGCVVDSGRGCGPSDVTFSWSLAAPGRASLSCEEVGAQTVVIIMGGAPAEFPCRNYAGITDPLPPATYTTSFQLLDAGRNVIASTDERNVTVEACGVNLGHVTFQTCAANNVSLSWSIVKAATGAPLSCAQAAATKVRLTMGQMEVDFFCSDGAGITPPVSAGTYPTSVDLLGAGDQPLAPRQSMNIVVPQCGGVTLPPITFAAP